MKLIKAAINLITALMIFAAGVEALETTTDFIRGKAVQSHKRGIMSLQKWNSQLHKKNPQK